MGDALLKFETTGKLSFKSFAVSILEDILKIENAKLVAGIASSIFGGSGGSTGILSGLTFGSGDSYLAKGGVYTSPSLSAYSGGVYDTPHAFKFANGGVPGKTGIFGEAGPEAILPLRRGSDGKLGVASSGGGSPVQVSIVTNVDSSGQSSSTATSSDSASAWGQLAQQMASTAKQQISTALQPGGLIYNKMNGR